MNLMRIVFVVFCAGLLGGAAYLSYFGIWGESLGLNTSIRAGSPGSSFGSGRIK